MQAEIKRESLSKKLGVPGIMLFYARHEMLISLVFLAIVIVLPVTVNKRYVSNIMINCATYSILALSLTLQAGVMGIVSLGHAAFYGIGAYTAALLATRLNVPIYLTFVAALFVTGVFGLLVGTPTSRIKGKYLPLITLGFCEIIRLIELNWMELTNGPMGIPQIPTFNSVSLLGRVIPGIRVKFYVVLICLLFTLYIVRSIINSRTGRAIMTIRDDEVAASFMGINVFKYKVMIFGVSAALAGLAGAFYAHNITFIDPKSFTFDQSILFLSMVILGGMGSLPGAIIGAVVMAVLPELLRSFVEYRQVIYGFIIVFMVIFAPKGLLGAYNTKYIRQRYHKLMETEAKLTDIRREKHV